MRIINDVRRTSRLAAGGREAEAVVRARGIDARVGERGYAFEMLTPVEIRVDGRTYAVPPERPNVLRFVVVPVAAFALMRLLRRKER